jgi:hypothetical protein
VLVRVSSEVCLLLFLLLFQDTALAEATAMRSQERECETIIRGALLRRSVILGCPSDLMWAGMLTNQESMTLERIHTMIRLITSGSTDSKFRFDMNLVQLKRFMQTLCDTEKIEIIEGGAYRLRRGPL